MIYSVHELHDKMRAGEKFTLVDVRESDEWQMCRLPGAQLIPLSQFTCRAPQELNAQDRIILYCHHGIRSAKAQQFLLSQGFTDVTNLAGGIDDWALHIDTSMRRY
jgi:adenylyltransferase/sulfurtransferase